MSMTGKNTRAWKTEHNRTAARLQLHQKLKLEFCDLSYSVEEASRMAFNIVCGLSDKDVFRGISDE